MGRAVGYVLLALCLLIGYQSYENGRNDPATEATAKLTACSIDATCVLKAERPSAVSIDIVGRRYQFSTNLGAVKVICNRQWIWLGHWKCRSERGEL